MKTMPGLFFNFLKPYRWHMLLVFFCVALTTAAGLAAPGSFVCWCKRCEPPQTLKQLGAAFSG
jgi:hypothetical protein